jgi:hypothetical protein
VTSLTLDEFRRVVPPFEAAFQSHMAQWRFDGQPRSGRRYTTYQNCPLPTPEDRLLFKGYPDLGSRGLQSKEREGTQRRGCNS